MSTDDRSDEDQALDAPVVTRVARGEWITLAAFVALALLVHQQILGPLTEGGYASGDAVNNAALFPRLVANLILGLCALQLVQLLRRRVVLSAEFLQQATRANARRCGIGFAILVAYLAGLPVLGFYPATVLFVLAMLVTLNTRPVWVAAIIAVLLSGAVGYVFEDLLRVVLPHGQIGIAW